MGTDTEEANKSNGQAALVPFTVRLALSTILTHLRLRNFPDYIEESVVVVQHWLESTKPK